MRYYTRSYIVGGFSVHIEDNIVGLEKKGCYTIYIQVTSDYNITSSIVANSVTISTICK